MSRSKGPSQHNTSEEYKAHLDSYRLNFLIYILLGGRPHQTDRLINAIYMVIW
jgi:hypothetical protein